MHLQLVRLIKAFCPDFQPIRHILTNMGAIWVEQMAQVDYFFRLPIRTDASTAPRLKLRVEDQQPRCVYYYTRDQDTASTITFQHFEVHDPVIMDILTAALGIETVVQKQREVWRTEHGIFNLDHLYRVGQIFEVEIEVDDQDQDRHVLQAGYYQQLFRPYLGADIHGSNEDRVPVWPIDPDGDVIE